MTYDYSEKLSFHLVSQFPEPRANLPACKQALEEELEELVSRGVFRLVSKRELQPNANLLGGRIIRCVKNVVTASERFKARFVVQGHRDSEKGSLIHDSAALRQSSLRLMLSIA